MTTAQKLLRELTEKQSKQRQQMAEFAKADTLTDEQRSELDTIENATPDLERQLRAAQRAVDDEETEQRKAGETGDTKPDAEQLERIELRSKAQLTNFVLAAISGRNVSGAEAELQAAAGINGGVPLEIFDTAERRKRLEDRVDVQTDAPGTVGVNLDPIRPAVFANAVLPRLGVEMPRVMSGTFASATIDASLTAAAKAQGADAEASAATFAVTSTTPKRISGRLSIQIEDIAAVGQANFESALRQNLMLVMGDALDTQGLTGDGSGAHLTGLLQRLTDATDPTAVATFDTFAAAHAGGVDGLWSETLRDVVILCGPATYRLACSVFQTAANYKGELSAAAYAMANTGGLWTSKRMPDPSNSDFQKAILYRMGRSMQGGGGAIRTAVCPHWNVLSIDDIYSGSASGTRHVTMHVLLGDVILTQPDAYSELAFQTP